MNLIKTLVREELTIFNEKVKLTNETLSLIENQDYVKYVLGINVPLNESQSFETKQIILQEALNIQTLATSIKNYVGDAVNTVVDGVKDMKDILTIIYQIATDKTGELAKQTAESLKNYLTKSFDDFKAEIIKIKEKIKLTGENIEATIENILNKVLELTKKLANYEGLTGILAILGLVTLLTWLGQKYLSKITKFIGGEIITTIKKALTSYSNFFKEIFSTIGINDIIKFFKNFDAVLGSIVTSAEIITIMANILRQPLIIIKNEFNLEKK